MPGSLWGGNFHKTTSPEHGWSYCACLARIHLVSRASLHTASPPPLAAAHLPRLTGLGQPTKRPRRWALLETVFDDSFEGKNGWGSAEYDRIHKLNRVDWIWGSSTAPYLGMRTDWRQDDEGRVSLRSISENTLVSMVRGLQRLQVHGPRSFDKCVSGTAAITSTIENTYITRFPCAALQSLRHLAPGNHICFL